MNESERYEIPCSDLVKPLWRKYRKTNEYKSGRRFSINSTHPLIRLSEEHGLSDIVLNFARELENSSDIRLNLTNRKATDWIEDWQRKHHTLFRYTYRETGKLRPKGYDVRFGTPGDEDVYQIPHGGAQVYNELYTLAQQLCDTIGGVKISNVDEVCRFLARFHYGFIRIHPFFDGNGRIARVITDQLSVALGYIPIIAGFPRNNTDKKRIYHAAIRAAACDPTYGDLTSWIKIQLQTKLAEIA